MQRVPHRLIHVARIKRVRLIRAVPGYTEPAESPWREHAKGQTPRCPLSGPRQVTSGRLSHEPSSCWSVPVQAGAECAGSRSAPTMPGSAVFMANIRNAARPARAGPT